MAAIGTGNHPKALWPGVKAWWGRRPCGGGARGRECAAVSPRLPAGAAA